MTNFDPSDPFAHILTKIYEGVRKSQLLLAFHKKLGDVPAGGFAFATELEKLCETIVPQIGETRILFPEFTPHDEQQHVAKLFALADKFFDSGGYERLNVAELFLLAAGLYAHDWGMAVGQDEKAYLAGGADPSLLRDTFAPLAEEEERLRAFARAEGTLVPDTSSFPTLNDDQLRLYVRQTHARRSAARVRKHFIEFPAVGEALAQICEGHWHDFALLDDPERFHREYDAAGYTNNILALTLYLRLIDLFHLTDDRTPYALWRFVSPRDKRSAEAWKSTALCTVLVSKVFFQGGKSEYRDLRKTRKSGRDWKTYAVIARIRFGIHMNWQCVTFILDTLSTSSKSNGT